MSNAPSEYEVPPVTPSEGATYGDHGATVPAQSPTWPPSDAGQSSLSGQSGQSGDQSTADVAKQEAGSVKDTAVDAGQNVAATAKDEVRNVAQETKQQARSLLSSVTSEVQSQAGNQQQKVASGVHALAKELGGMASASPESGPLTDLAQQASQRGGEIAHWLENHEPRDLLHEVASFGRRRPVTFLALCGLAGVVAGRLTRGAVAANTSLDTPSSSGGGDARRALDTAPGGPAYAPAYTTTPAPAPAVGYGEPAGYETPVDYAPPAGPQTAAPIDPVGYPNPDYPSEGYPTQDYPNERPGGVR